MVKQKSQKKKASYLTRAPSDAAYSTPDLRCFVIASAEPKISVRWLISVPWLIWQQVSIYNNAPAKIRSDTLQIQQANETNERNATRDENGTQTSQSASPSVKLKTKNAVHRCVRRRAAARRASRSVSTVFITANIVSCVHHIVSREFGSVPNSEKIHSRW